MKYCIAYVIGAAALSVSSFVLHPVNRRHRVVTQVNDAKDSVVQTSSASAFSGAGPPLVDMNTYNLALNDIAQEWTAALVPATALQEEGIYLGAKSKDTVLVDTLKVQVPRRMGEGLGLELLEIAGGRADGRGITVINGFVEGGVSENRGFELGDSIVKVAVRKQSQSRSSATSVEEINEESAVETECLGFDMTVEALGSLPPQESDDETFLLTIKRLRRKPKVKLNLQFPPNMNEPDMSLELFSGENLRRAMLVRGVKLNDPLARRFDSGGSGDCGAEGTCATCTVSITRGDDLLNPKGTTEEQILQKNPRWRMACKTIVGYGMKEGELTVRVAPKQW